MDTYGHLFEGSDRESAERMDHIFGGKKAEAPQDIESPANLVVMPGKISSHADKSAKTEIVESVSALF